MPCGTSGSQRLRAMRYVRYLIRRGQLCPPLQCEACGQREGVIDYYTEDYHHPFGSHLWQLQLCFRCRCMVLCRDRNEKAFDTYRRQILDGVRFAPMKDRNYLQFVQDHLVRQGCMVSSSFVEKPRTDLLGRIAAGEFRPHAEA